MILIVDNTERKYINNTRNELMKAGMPCAVSKLTDSLDLLFPARFCVVTERYLFEDVKLMASFHQKASFVTLLEETKDFTELLLKEYEGFLEEDRKRANGKGINFKNGFLYYYGKVLRLTKSESRIINMLIASDDYCTWESISAYCLRSKASGQGSVAVHITNINNKTQRLFKKDIIECKRYLGYILK